MFRKLLLTHKIMSIAVLGSLGFVAYLIFNYTTAMNNRDRIVDIRDIKFPVLELTSDLRGDIFRLQARLVAAATEEDEQELELALEIHTRVSGILLKMEQTDASLLTEIQAVRSALDNYYNAASKVALGFMNGDVEIDALRVLLKDNTVRLKQLEDGIQQFRDKNFERFLVVLKETETSGYQAVQLGMIFGVVLVIVLFLISFVVGRWIANGVNRVVESINHMVVGDADLTARFEKESDDEIGMLVDEFNALLAKLQGIFRQNISASKSINEGIAVLYTAAQDAKDGSERQINEVSDIVTAMSLLTDSSDNVIRQMSLTTEQIDAAILQSDRNCESVIVSRDLILKLAEEVELGCEVVTRFTEEMANIEQASAVIKSVADQTNLLALNAAIEAARAGEHGRGFAVVADEVRTLATRTAESTGEISQIIEVIQNGASDAVKVMATSKKYAVEGGEMVTKNVDSMRQVIASIEEIKRDSGNVTSAATVQLHIVDTVSTKVKNIQVISSESAETTAKMETSSGQIAKQAESLERDIKGFKV